MPKLSPLSKVEPNSDTAKACAYGVPLESHRRCAACGWLMGCSGELRPGQDERLCFDCWDAGKRLVIRGRRQKYLKPQDVAAELGISHVSVLRLIRAGRLQAIPLHQAASPTGIRYLVPAAALKAYVAGGAPVPGPTSGNSAQLGAN